jgi:hypothetical protein
MMGDQELSRRERHALLVQTVQQYQSDWRLAGIRASEDDNHLIAYFVPRHKPVKLQTALRTHQALIITLNSAGHRVITPPQRVPLWRRLLARWFGRT